MHYNKSNQKNIKCKNSTNCEKKYGDILIVSAIGILPSVFEKIEMEDKNREIESLILKL